MYRYGAKSAQYLARSQNQRQFSQVFGVILNEPCEDSNVLARRCTVVVVQVRSGEETAQQFARQFLRGYKFVNEMNYQDLVGRKVLYLPECPGYHPIVRRGTMVFLTNCAQPFASLPSLNPASQMRKGLIYKDIIIVPDFSAKVSRNFNFSAALSGWTCSDAKSSRCISLWRSQIKYRNISCVIFLSMCL